MAKSFRREFLIFPILALGLILRTIGLDWGLPGTKFFHSYSLHSDETSVLHMIRSMKPRELNFKLYSHPIQYGNGVFHGYVAAGALGLAAGLRLITIKSDYDWYKSNPKELAKIYLAGRWLNVFLGLFCIWLVYKIGTAAFGPSVGLLSAFMLSLAPNHVVNSHYFSRDITMTTCVLLGIWALFFVQRSRQSLMLAGFFIGLAAATKNVAGSFAVFIPLALIFKVKPDYEYKKIILLAFGILGCLIGFLIGHPYVLIDFKEYWQALQESTLVNLPQFVSSKATYPSGGFRFYLGEALYYGLGLPLMILVLGSVLYALIKRTKWDGFFLIGTLPYFVIISLSSWGLVRWMVALTPFLLILSGRFIVEILNFNHRRRLSYVIAIAVGLGLVHSFCYSLSYVLTMREKTVHIQVSEWMVANIPMGRRIGVKATPFMWHPTLVIQEYFYKEGDPARQGQKKLYTIVNLENSLDKLKKEKPEYITLADFEYEPLAYLGSGFMGGEYLALVKEIFFGGSYQEVVSFKKVPSFFGIRFVSGFYPHDWRYPFPEIKIFKRKDT